MRHLVAQGKQTSRVFRDSQANGFGDQNLSDRRRLPGPESKGPTTALSPSRTGALTWKSVLLLALSILLSGCRPQTATAGRSIEFSKIPQAGEGGPDRINTLEGRVIGARPGQQVVLL